MIRTKAIVLSHLKFRDTSLIVRCYTLEGVRSYLLKGVLSQKKKALSEIGCSVLQEEYPNPSLFSFWEESLQWYDRAEYFANFHLKFLVDLTLYLGVLPNTSAMELPYFDLEAGVFVAMHNGHSLMSEEESLLLKFFLSHSLEEVCLLKMTREERNSLLEQLLNYYLWHLPNFQIPKSWEVLKSVL